MKKNPGYRHHNGGNASRQQGGQHAPRAEDMPLDFNPRQQLDKTLRSRPIQQGITIDPVGTYIIDDGLWVRPHNQGWHITVSIADLPSMIPPHSRLEEAARLRMEEDVVGKGLVRRLWPVQFLENFVSLRAFPNGATRPAVTFTMILDKNLDVEHFKVRRTAFFNKGQHSDGAFQTYKDFPQDMASQWQRLARSLYQKRCRELGHSFDRHLFPEADEPPINMTKDKGNMRDGKLLVHEVMRLTNRMATLYFEKHDLTVPFKNQKVGINATMVSPSYEFDLAANRMCIKLMEYMAEQELPYVHLNSPMRKYGDYLAMKVLGTHLNGHPQSEHVRREIEDLSSIFNRHAARVPDFLLQQRWKGEWHGILRRQTRPHMQWHPQPVPQQRASYELVKTCSDLNMEKPLIAERKLMVQGAFLYFTAMQVDRGRFLSWAVSHNAAQSNEQAAARIINAMAQNGLVPPRA